MQKCRTHQKDEKFLPQKKDVKVFMSSQEFSSDLARKMMVEMVIVVVPAGGFEGVKRVFYRK